MCVPSMLFINFSVVQSTNFIVNIQNQYKMKQCLYPSILQDGMQVTSLSFLPFVFFQVFLVNKSRDHSAILFDTVTLALFQQWSLYNGIMQLEKQLRSYIPFYPSLGFMLAYDV